MLKNFILICLTLSLVMPEISARSMMFLPHRRDRPGETKTVYIIDDGYSNENPDLISGPIHCNDFLREAQQGIANNLPTMKAFEDQYGKLKEARSAAEDFYVCVAVDFDFEHPPGCKETALNNVEMFIRIFFSVEVEELNSRLLVLRGMLKQLYEICGYKNSHFKNVLNGT
eukprot:TRINITY_DN6936_c0_g1_i1.p1 TRINITY_DN6936_c0_g1~~TRINITY_DN6936_c0_g1_i1.p1  ORF type:complete len:171 (+),score=57.22 TRINITY_DN6936_c0_g1_i1:160-672(+)